MVRRQTQVISGGYSFKAPLSTSREMSPRIPGSHTLSRDLLNRKPEAVRKEEPIRPDHRPGPWLEQPQQRRTRGCHLGSTTFVRERERGRRERERGERERERERGERERERERVYMMLSKPEEAYTLNDCTKPLNPKTLDHPPQTKDEKT